MTVTQPTDKMTVYEAKSGRLHAFPGCTGGPGRHRMRKVRVSRSVFDHAVKCRCLSWGGQWRFRPDASNLS
jgi:hypothetical protein